MFATLRVGIVIVIVHDGFFNGTIQPAAHHASAHAKAAASPSISRMTAEPVQDSLNSFKGECAGGYSGCGLHGAPQKTRWTGCDVLRLLILRLRVLGR